MSGKKETTGKRESYLSKMTREFGLMFHLIEETPPAEKKKKDILDDIERFIDNLTDRMLKEVLGKSKGSEEERILENGGIFSPGSGRRKPLCCPGAGTSGTVRGELPERMYGSRHDAGCRIGSRYEGSGRKRSADSLSGSEICGLLVPLVGGEGIFPAEDGNRRLIAGESKKNRRDRSDGSGKPPCSDIRSRGRVWDGKRLHSQRVA